MDPELRMNSPPSWAELERWRIRFPSLWTTAFRTQGKRIAVEQFLVEFRELFISLKIRKAGKSS